MYRQRKNRVERKDPAQNCCGCICCIVIMFLSFGFFFLDLIEGFFYYDFISIFVGIIVFIVFVGIISSVIQSQRRTFSSGDYKKLDTYDKRIQYRKETGRLPVIMGIPSSGYKIWLKKESSETPPITYQPQPVAPGPPPILAPQPMRAPTPPPAPAAPVERVEASFCPFCGSKITKGSRICESCGSPTD